MAMQLSTRQFLAAKQAKADHKAAMRRAITTRVGAADAIIFGREGELIRVGWIKAETGQGVDITRLVAAAFDLQLHGNALIGANIWKLIEHLLDVVPSNDWRMLDLDPRWKQACTKAA